MSISELSKNGDSTTRRISKTKPGLPTHPDDRVGRTLALPGDSSRIDEGGMRLRGKYKRSGSDLPLVSIICAVFNGEDHLEDAFTSVMQQDYDNVELIVIDGGSSDGSLQVIRDYDDRIDYWISEKDDGIADAWNKGLECATGDIIGFLNADDFYDPGALSIIAEFARDKLDRSIVMYGDTQMIEGGVCGRFIKGSFDPDRLHYGFGFMHTSCFSTRAAYNEIGGFNTGYKIAIDTDWLVRAVVSKFEFRRVSCLTHMRAGGVSDTLEWAAFQEYLQIMQEYGIGKVFTAKYVFLVKLALRTIIGKRLLDDMRMQLIYLIIFTLNITYNWLPFFSLKKLFISGTGVKIGNDSYVHTPVRFFSKGRIEIGDNTTVNPGCYLDNRGNIKIGNNVSIARDTKIYTAGHDVNDPCFRRTEKDVVIEDDVCIFANVMILPGLTIGKGAVVYPGSVVTKDVDEYSIIGGNPAKHLKFRNKDIQYKIDYKYWFSQ